MPATPHPVGQTDFRQQRPPLQRCLQDPVKGSRHAGRFKQLMESHEQQPCHCDPLRSGSQFVGQGACLGSEQDGEYEYSHRLQHGHESQRPHHNGDDVDSHAAFPVGSEC